MYTIKKLKINKLNIKKYIFIFIVSNIINKYKYTHFNIAVRENILR